LPFGSPVPCITERTYHRVLCALRSNIDAGNGVGPLAHVSPRNTRAVAEPSTPTELIRARAVTCGLLAYTESSLERVTCVLTRARGLSDWRHLLCLPMNSDARNAVRSSSVRSTSPSTRNRTRLVRNARARPSSPCWLISTPWRRRRVDPTGTTAGSR